MNEWVARLKWGSARVLIAFLISIFVSMWAWGYDYYWAAVVMTFWGIGVSRMVIYGVNHLWAEPGGGE